jgi:prepilin-type N-terminal cleavage/methylation domain-containing protein
MRKPKTRQAFTLVEMMVAIAILLALAALAYFFVPQVFSRQMASEGASQLQGWIFMAQQRAKRDLAPRGIRLNLSQGATPQYVTDLQFIEQPDDYYVFGAVISSITGTTVSFTGLDFFGGNGPGTPALWQVQVGDYLIVNSGLPHQITAVGPANAAAGTTLTLAPVAVTTVAGMNAVAPGTNVTIALTSVANIPIGCYVDLDYLQATAEAVQVTAVDPVASTITVAQVTGNHAAGSAVGSAGLISKLANPQWTVRRQPRVLVGEETLQLPQDVAVDLSISMLGSTVASQVGGNIDIIFDRQGMVIGPMTAFDKIMLWVRDTTQPAPTAAGPNDGSHTLVVIYCRTGGIASHPANFDPNLGDWYAFAREGRSSGE